MNNRGIVFRVLAAVVMVAALAGCGGVPPTGGGLGAAAGAAVAQEALSADVGPAAVGECWQLTYGGYLQQPENVGGTLVDCDQPHQAITYAVVNLEQNLSRTGIESLAFQTCQHEYADAFPNAGNKGRVFLSEILPSDADWATGSRAVSCTVQSSKTGSPFRYPVLADLPKLAEFESAVNSSATAYSLCVDDPGTNGITGPRLGSEAILADCASGQWMLEPSRDFIEPAGAPYPTDAARVSYMHNQCGALYDTAARRAWDFYPSEQQWNKGDRAFMCWTGSR